MQGFIPRNRKHRSCSHREGSCDSLCFVPVRHKASLHFTNWRFNVKVVLVSCPTSSRKSVTGPWIELWVFECWTRNLLAAIYFIIHQQLLWSSFVLVFAVGFYFYLSNLLYQTILSVYMLMTPSCLLASGFLVVFSGVSPLVNSGCNSTDLLLLHFVLQSESYGTAPFCGFLLLGLNAL